MICTIFTLYFLGRRGGATTFASAKVKNAIGRIGIFFKEFASQKNTLNLFFIDILKIISKVMNFESEVKLANIES